MSEEQTTITAGSYWRHTNGNIYNVLFLTNLPDEDRYPLTVVYQGQNGNRWSRLASDWHRSMTSISSFEAAIDGWPMKRGTSLL